MRITWAVLAGLALASAVRAQGLKQPVDPAYLSHAIARGGVKLWVYLPDARKGVYRGTRFDWSGLVAQAQWQRHSFFAPWKDTHDPANHDDILGTAEEFGMESPLGFAEAKAGETFIKIGIGHLRKGRDADYGFWKKYDIVKPAEWKVMKTDASIRFEQALTDGRGWSYQYTKTVEVLEDEPGFVIRRMLKNTGTRAIETDHYGHNFVSIDGQKIGPAYRLSVPFSIATKQPPQFHGVGRIQGNQILLSDAVAPDKALWAAIEGFRGEADHAALVENTRTGAAVSIQGDLPVSRFAVYIAATAACPEPFVAINLQPGQEMRWSTRYILRIDQPVR